MAAVPNGTRPITRRRTRIRRIGVLVICGIAAMLLIDDCAFLLLRVGFPDWIERPIANYLAANHRGVSLALADCDVWGGTTRFLSSYIIENARVPDMDVDGELRSIVQSRAPIDRRMEALCLLATRTGDSSYAIKLFELVRPGGGPVIGMGRQRLTGLITYGRDRFSVDYRKPLDIDQATFQRLLAGEWIGADE